MTYCNSKTNNFVHLRVHSEYSLRDGLVRIPHLIKRTRNMGMQAICITDDTNLFALVKYYKTAQCAGIKPIIGSEILMQNQQDVKHPYRLTLLAMNNEGYSNLTSLISRGWQQGVNGRVLMQKKWIFEASNGLIALSGAREGEIGRLMLYEHGNQARTRLAEWQRFFHDRFYLELQRTGRQFDDECLHLSVALAIETGTPVVATNDVRFINRNDFFAHSTRVAIGERRPVDCRRYSNEQYLKSPDEMMALFSDIPQALENSVMIAARCNVNVRLGKYFLPFYPVPIEFNKVAYSGLEKRLGRPGPKYRSRLAFELKIINQMGLQGYFLIVMDFIRWAKLNNVPVGPGRGSGAGSLVAYSLEITDIDPLEYDLLFERFLNPERVEMPDLDVDFCMKKREKVINYVTDRYGRDSVSKIVTFSTMTAKVVVRDVARALGKPYSLGDKLSKMIPVGMTLNKAIEQESTLKTLIESDDEVGEIWDMAIELEGLTRGTGKHAGGVVIAPTKLTDFAPLLNTNTNTNTNTKTKTKTKTNTKTNTNLVVQFDKNDIEEAGLVKFDFLGLRTLTIIDLALDMINARCGKVDIATIQFNDSKTFDMLQNAETTAIFQLESRGMKELIKRLQPNSINDLIALVALFRPGPLQSGMVDDFINRKHGREKLSYPHPDYQHELLKPVLEPTYGIILFQEQVMQIAQVLAGYTLGQAEMLRSAIGKKIPDDMIQQRAIFIEGCAGNEIDKVLAENIFLLLEKFARYGFNKSHSTAYGIVSYKTAWLKAHYPAQFMAAVISTYMGNIDKVVLLIEECQRMNITVTTPDINRCEQKFCVSDQGEIVYGLGAIRGVGEKPIEAIVSSRKQKGLFSDLFDLCKRVGILNKRNLEALIKAGALDHIGPSRAVLSAALDDALKAAEHDEFIDDMFVDEEDCYARYANVRQWTDRERLCGEKLTLGIYITGHPIDEYKSEIKRLVASVASSISDIKQSRKQQRVAGLIVGISTLRSKGGENLALLRLEDRTGRIEASLFCDVHKLVDVEVVIVEGKVSDISGVRRILVRKITHMFKKKKC